MVSLVINVESGNISKSTDFEATVALVPIVGDEVVVVVVIACLVVSSPLDTVEMILTVVLDLVLIDFVGIIVVVDLEFVFVNSGGPFGIVGIVCSVDNVGLFVGNLVGLNVGLAVGVLVGDTVDTASETVTVGFGVGDCVGFVNGDGAFWHCVVVPIHSNELALAV